MAQIFVAVLGASSYTFATASLSQDLADWIESHCRAFSFFGGVTRSVMCDNLKSAVVKPLWFEPTLNPTFEAFSEHYGATVLPARVRKPRDKGKVERSVQLVERWILARLRNRRFFSLGSFNKAIAELLLDLNDRPMRHVGRSRRELFDAGEQEVLAPLPGRPFEYAEWKRDCQIVCAWADFQTLTKRSPKMMANCVLASVHSRGGRFQAWAA